MSVKNKSDKIQLSLFRLAIIVSIPKRQLQNSPLAT
ncbi:hypothetical protein BGS_1172 [Beggiatoa sp. SS]|nr:hypothetical protein BGS_1172 [Beggiatoa sp. SS]